jgi:hypothetical protein
MDFGPAELWHALIHFESEEKTKPFTTDYFAAAPSIRQKFIAHACLDASLPGNSVPDDIVDYLAERLRDNLLEICSLVHHRNSFSVSMLEEVLGASSKTLALGVL